MMFQKMMFLFAFSLVSGVFGGDSDSEDATGDATAAASSNDEIDWRELTLPQEKDAYITLMKKMDRIIDKTNPDPEIPGYEEIFPKDPFSFSDSITFALNVIGSIYPKKRMLFERHSQDTAIKDKKRKDLDSIFQKIYTKYFKEKNAKDRGYILSLTVNRDPNKSLKAGKGSAVDLTGEKTYFLTLTIDFKQDKNTFSS